MIEFYPICDIDNRIEYASKYLSKCGFKRVDSFENADFILLGVNPKNFLDYSKKPIFAGNVSGNNVFDYTKDEAFALYNASLTAEGAISLAIQNSKSTLINSNVLIIGYGRIAKALAKYILPFTKNITICLRNNIQRQEAELMGYNIISFEQLILGNDYDFVFNTVPHPVIGERELKAIPNDSLIVDIASFPGGVDVHFSSIMSKKLIVARSLPALYSPKSAGIAVAKTVMSMLPKKEEII